MRGSRPARGRSTRRRADLVEPAVQVGGRDLVDPELCQLADPLEATVRRPGDREVVDQLAREPAGVLGRRVEVALVVVVGLRRAPRRAGSAPRACRGRVRAASRRAMWFAAQAAAQRLSARASSRSSETHMPQKSGDLDLVRDRGPPPRARRASARSAQRTAAGIGADLGHGDVCERAGEPEVLRPGRGDGDRHVLAGRPADADRPGVGDDLLAGRAARGCAARPRRSFCVATCLSPSVRTALSPRPRPRITRPGMELGQRRRRARADRVVACERVRDGRRRAGCAPSRASAWVM